MSDRGDSPIRPVAEAGQVDVVRRKADHRSAPDARMDELAPVLPVVMVDIPVLAARPDIIGTISPHRENLVGVEHALTRSRPAGPIEMQAGLMAERKDVIGCGTPNRVNDDPLIVNDLPGAAVEMCQDTVAVRGRRVTGIPKPAADVQVRG